MLLTCPAGYLFRDTFQGMYGPRGAYPMHSPLCTNPKLFILRSTLLFGCFACGEAQYSVLGGSSNGTAGVVTNPRCLPCPAGATCTGPVLKPLLNHWGRHDVAGVVHMAQCPGGYCCVKGECNISSCAPHRHGALCGDCDPGYVQSVGAATCVPVSACDSDIPASWPVVVVVVFVLGLLQLKVVSGVWSATQRRPSSKAKPLIYFAQVGVWGG